MRDQKLHQILKATFGYDSFRLEQLNIIRSVLDGHDTLAIMPTGGGKSLCYQIPALYLDGITLVISPLISLMKDQVVNLQDYGVKAAFLNSTLSFREKHEIQAKVRSQEIKILYVSPEGVLSPALQNFLTELQVSLIAIDEAHCVSQWGHEFRRDYTRLAELKLLYPKTPMLALTATADAKTRNDIAQQLLMFEPKTFVSSFDRPNIKYAILERQDEIKQLRTFIETHHPQDTGIVYCLSRDKVERLAEALVELGYPAVPYHAGLPAKQRTENQERFSREERVIVVATIAFGMGIDRPDVRFVAHLDLPKSVEGYYQETGRAGRDGKPSTAWMIYGLQDVVKLSQMLELTQADESYKKVARHKLDSMLALGELGACRRKFLLNYFGQEAPDSCGNCDNCLEPPKLWDATVDAQKLLSTIVRTQQIFGAGYIIDVLRGSHNQKILERGHDKLSVYGIGKDESKEHWNSVLRQLLHSGYIGIRNWEYKSLCLTEKCQEVLKGQVRLQFRKRDTALSKKEGRSAKAARTAQAEAAHGRPELFQALKGLRLKLAREQAVPPYIILNDRALHEMCLLLPRNPSELLLVNGVGQAKQEKYGDAFLRVIDEYRAEA